MIFLAVANDEKTLHWNDKVAKYPVESSNTHTNKHTHFVLSAQLATDMFMLYTRKVYFRLSNGEKLERSLAVVSTLCKQTGALRDLAGWN